VLAWVREWKARVKSEGEGEVEGNRRVKSEERRVKSEGERRVKSKYL
jgi:hypothetical protein